MEGSTQLSVLLTRLKNYLPLAGGIMTGDINIGAQKIIGTDISIYRGAAGQVYIKDHTATTFKALALSTLMPTIGLAAGADAIYIAARNSDANYMTEQARASGVGLAEISRLVGAATPYRQFTNGLRLLPTTTPIAVEGMIYYHDTEKCLKYRNDAGEVYPGHEIHRRGILADFQANAATGDSATQANLNDNNTATVNTFDTINKYSQVDFGKVVRLTQFRYFGDANMNADGAWKIQYWNNVTGAWTDWVTGKATNVAAWSGWDSTGGEILTDMIRWVATTLDSFGDSRIGELEVIY